MNGATDGRARAGSEFPVQIVVSRHMTLLTDKRYPGVLRIVGLEIRAKGVSEGIPRGLALVALLPALFIVAGKNFGAFTDLSVWDIALICGITGGVLGAFGWVVQQILATKARAPMEPETITVEDGGKMVRVRCFDGRHLYVFADPKYPLSFRQFVGEMEILKTPRQIT